MVSTVQLSSVSGVFLECNHKTIPSIQHVVGLCVIVSKIMMLLTQVPGSLQAARFVFPCLSLWHIWLKSLVLGGSSPLPPPDDNKQTVPVAQHTLSYYSGSAQYYSTHMK
jgi:hypothetical protein